MRSLYFEISLFWDLYILRSLNFEISTFWDLYILRCLFLRSLYFEISTKGGGVSPANKFSFWQTRNFLALWVAQVLRSLNFEISKFWDLYILRSLYFKMSIFEILIFWDLYILRSLYFEISIFWDLYISIDIKTFKPFEFPYFENDLTVCFGKFQCYSLLGIQ